MSRLALLAVVPLVFAGAALSEVMRESAPSGIKLTLEQVKEIRSKSYVKDVSNNFSMFDTPGLHLQLAIDAPKSRKIVEVRPPSEIVARDSTGLDLSKLPPTPFGEPKHVETIQEWDKPPHALSVRLGLPRRSAETFTLTAKMDALTYSSTKESTIEAGPEAKEVPAGLLGPGTFTVRVKRQQGSVHVVFEPGAAHDFLEKVELLHDGAPLETEGTMWNDKQVAYMFTAAARPGAVGTAMTAKLTVRQSVGVVPLTIELKDEPLP